MYRFKELYGQVLDEKRLLEESLVEKGYQTHHK
jgi:hypothetical protein